MSKVLFESITVRDERIRLTEFDHGVLFIESDQGFGITLDTIDAVALRDKLSRWLDKEHTTCP